MEPQDIPHRIEALADLDAASATVGKLVRDTIQPGPIKDALQGRWMGHALHPLLTDMVIGTWTSGLLLDLTGGRGGDRLVAAGIICAVPTALTGATDWAEVEARDPSARRVGIVHGLANAAALGLQLGSLLARGRGQARSGGRAVGRGQRAARGKRLSRRPPELRARCRGWCPRADAVLSDQRRTLLHPTFSGGGCLGMDAECKTLRPCRRSVPPPNSARLLAATIRASAQWRRSKVDEFRDDEDARARELAQRRLP